MLTLRAKKRRVIGFAALLFLLAVIACCPFTALASDELEDSNFEQDGVTITAESAVSSLKQLDLVPAENEAQVCCDMELLEDANVLVGDIVSVDYSVSPYRYEMAIDDELSDFVQVEEAADGTITLRIVEGDIENELVIEPSGDLILDGFVLEGSVSVVEEPGLVPEVMPFSTAGSYFTTTNPCPDKTWVKHETVKENYNIGKILGDLSVTALSGIIGKISKGVPKAVLQSAAKLFKKESPNSKYVSCKSVVYYPKGGRLYYNKNGIVKYAEKHARTMYPTSNCTGSVSKTKTVYKIIEIG